MATKFSRYNPHASPTIAFIAGTYQPDRCGVAHYTDRLRHSLHDRGVESIVLTTHAAVSDDSTLLGVVDGWELADIWLLARAVAATPADILHIQHAAGTYGFQRSIFLLPILLRLLGDRTPIVTTVHEYGWWEWQPPGIPTAPLEWLKQTGQQRGWWDREDGFLLTGSQALITTNANAAAVIRERLPHRAKELQVIPIGSNVAVTPIARSIARQQLRQQFGWSEEAVAIGFFGFLHPVKGLENLLHAFQQVSEQQSQARLLLIGGVESLALTGNEAQQYWHRLHALAQELGVGDRVQFTGFVAAETASRYLSGCDLGVLPFNHGVTLKSGSLLALFAHRLPVIATQSDPPDPALTDAQVLLIPRRSVESLTAALLELLMDAERRDRLATAGYEFGQPFNWDAIGRQHLQIYNQVCRVARTSH